MACGVSAHVAAVNIPASELIEKAISPIALRSREETTCATEGDLIADLA
jgi:hypothetical protein